jgi:hypothetical protein
MLFLANFLPKFTGFDKKEEEDEADEDEDDDDDEGEEVSESASEDDSFNLWLLPPTVTR